LENVVEMGIEIQIGPDNEPVKAKIRWGGFDK
jgi:hypothetical protein